MLFPSQRSWFNKNTEEEKYMTREKTFYSQSVTLILWKHKLLLSNKNYFKIICDSNGPTCKQRMMNMKFLKRKPLTTYNHHHIGTDVWSDSLGHMLATSILIMLNMEKTAKIRLFFKSQSFVVFLFNFSHWKL